MSSGNSFEVLKPKLKTTAHGRGRGRGQLSGSPFLSAGMRRAAENFPTLNPLRKPVGHKASQNADTCNSSIGEMERFLDQCNYGDQDVFESSEEDDDEKEKLRGELEITRRLLQVQSNNPHPGTSSSSSKMVTNGNGTVDDLIFLHEDVPEAPSINHSTLSAPNAQVPSVPTSEFVSKEEFSELNSKLDRVLQMVSSTGSMNYLSPSLSPSPSFIHHDQAQASTPTIPLHDVYVHSHSGTEAAYQTTPTPTFEYRRRLEPSFAGDYGATGGFSNGFSAGRPQPQILGEDDRSSINSFPGSYDPLKFQLQQLEQEAIMKEIESDRRRRAEEEAASLRLIQEMNNQEECQDDDRRAEEEAASLRLIRELQHDDSQGSCVPESRPSVIGHLANQTTRNGSYFGGESSFPALASNNVSDSMMGWTKVTKPKQVRVPPQQKQASLKAAADLEKKRRNEAAMEEWRREQKMKEEEEKQRIVKHVVESRKVKSIKEVASTGPGHTNRAQSLNAAPLGDLVPQPQKRNAKKNDKNFHGTNELQRRRNVEELRQRIEQQVLVY